MMRRGTHLRPTSQGPGQVKASAGGTLISAAVAEKSALRKQLRAARARIPSAERERAARQAARRLLGMLEIRRARHVAVYLAAGSELDTRPLIRALRRQGKSLSAPRIDRCVPGRMHMLPLDDSQRPMRRNLHGIAEPMAARRAGRTVAVDVAIIPLLGFDRRGARLGSGAGFYDRWLARPGPRPYRLGFGFACQETALIPVEVWDLPLDAICTERSIQRFSPA